MSDGPGISPAKGPVDLLRRVQSRFRVKFWRETGHRSGLGDRAVPVSGRSSKAIPLRNASIISAGLLATACSAPTDGVIATRADLSAIVTTFDEVCLSNMSQLSGASSAFERRGDRLAGAGQHGIFVLEDGAILGVSDRRDLYAIETGEIVPGYGSSICAVMTAGTGSRNESDALLGALAPKFEAQGAKIERSASGLIEAILSETDNGRVRIDARTPSLPTGRVNKVQNDNGQFEFPDFQQTAGLALYVYDN